MMRALHFFLLLSPLFAKAESYDIFKEVTKIYQPVAKSLNQKFEIIICN